MTGRSGKYGMAGENLSCGAASPGFSDSRASARIVSCSSNANCPASPGRTSGGWTCLNRSDELRCRPILYRTEVSIQRNQAYRMRTPGSLPDDCMVSGRPSWSERGDRCRPPADSNRCLRGDRGDRTSCYECQVPAFRYRSF